jgi:hypothetical protein
MAENIDIDIFIKQFNGTNIVLYRLISSTLV